MLSVLDVVSYVTCSHCPPFLATWPLQSHWWVALFTLLCVASPACCLRISHVALQFLLHAFFTSAGPQTMHGYGTICPASCCSEELWESWSGGWWGRCECCSLFLDWTRKKMDTILCAWRLTEWEEMNGLQDAVTKETLTVESKYSLEAFPCFDLSSVFTSWQSPREYHRMERRKDSGISVEIAKQWTSVRNAWHPPGTLNISRDDSLINSISQVTNLRPGEVKWCFFSPKIKWLLHSIGRIEPSPQIPNSMSLPQTTLLLRRNQVS